MIKNFDTIDDIVSVWKSLFTEILDKHAPIKSHIIKRKYQPEWLTPEILDLRKERSKCKLNGNTTVYKALRNKVSALINIAKKETYRSKIEGGKSVPRTIWKLFNEFGMNNKERNKSKFSLKVDDQCVTNDADFVPIFNNYFQNIASKLKEPPNKDRFLKN